mgnify:FL=1
MNRSLAHGVTIDTAQTEGECDRCGNKRTVITQVFYWLNDQLCRPLFTRLFMHDHLCQDCVPTDEEIVGRLLAGRLSGR